MFIGVDCALQRTHQFYCRHAMFGFQILYRFLSDTMLAGAGPVHLNRPRDKAINEFLNLRDFIRIAVVHKRQAMEITVADVSHNRRQQAHVLDIALSFFNALGKT
jgi:hypothetical protein